VSSDTASSRRSRCRSRSARAAFAPPKPWEKGELAKPTMQYDAPAERLEAKYQEHVYHEQGSRGRRLRCGRRRLWLQLIPHLPSSARVDGGRGRPPGVVPHASAQSIPDEGSFSIRYLDYRDWQPGADRMRVKSPSFFVMKPFGGSWVAEGSLVYDGMSGASPRFYNTLSGSSGEGVKDYRTAGDAKLTRYFDRYAIGVGLAGSTERDYLSKAASLDLRWWTEDRNTTLAFSFAGTSIASTRTTTSRSTRRSTRSTSSSASRRRSTRTRSSSRT
jgi:hypothetical protein